MAFDAGGQVQGANPGVPPGVVPGSGVGVKVQEGGGGLGWVYLYVRSGSLDPAAGKNYVTYNFSLNSGSYKTTYKRWWVAGPPGNPETSSVVTPNYQIKFTDRWKETEWKVKASGASGVDFLDAAKLKINPNDCIRSNQTAAEGKARSWPTSMGRCVPSAPTSEPTAARTPSAPTSCTATAWT